jgi:hypothetical protein
MLATIKKYAKWVVTGIGVVLMIANEVLPIVPASAQHWVTAVIAVLTLVSRDITDLTSSSLFSVKAPSQP